MTNSMEQTIERVGRAFEEFKSTNSEQLERIRGRLARVG